jgi:hypothetical protein
MLSAAVLLIAAACLAVPFAAGATGTPPKPTPAVPASATQSQTQTSTSSASTGAIDLSLMTNPVANGGVGGSVDSGNTYVFPAPAAAAPLPSGLCPQGDSESWSIVWGFVSFARSSTRTEMECLDKVLAMLRETAPRPAAPPVVNYISQPPAPAAPAAPVVVECKAPAIAPAAKPKAPAKKASAPAACK